MSVLNILLGLMPFILIVIAVLAIIPLFRRWMHPARILTSALNLGFVLVVTSIAIPLPGATLMTWWLLAAVGAVGVVWACRRILLDPPPPPPQPAEGRRLTRAEKAQEKALTPPPLFELVLNVLIWGVLIVVMVLGG